MTKRKRKSTRKSLDPILLIDPITQKEAPPTDILEVTNGRVQHYWPWPFTDKVPIEEAADIAGVEPDHQLMHDTVALLRRHLEKRRLVKEMGLPAKAKPGKEIAALLKAAIAFHIASGHLSTEAFSLITEGGTDPALLNAMAAISQVAERAQQLVENDNYARAHGLSGALPASKGGRPVSARKILAGRIGDAFGRHLGPRPRNRRPFIEICLRAVDEATWGGPAIGYDAVEQMVRRERARKRREMPSNSGEPKPTKPA